MHQTASEDLSFHHVILYVLERRTEWQWAVFNKENETITPLQKEN